MTEQATKHHEGEMVTLGMAFMGFLMGAGAILGIWFLTGLLQVLSKLMGQEKKGVGLKRVSPAKGWMSWQYG